MNTTHCPECALEPKPGKGNWAGSRAQRGLISIGMLYLVLSLLFFMILAFKLGPAYLNHYKIATALSSLKFESDLGQKSPREVIGMLERRWMVDSVDAVTAENVSISRGLGTLRIDIAYDVTIPILGNVDALIHFRESLEVPTR